jgi:chemotaxis protein methyltransferase CheR
VIPSLIATHAREKRIRIWCTAASTGQEPYSIAMLLKSMAVAIARLPGDLLAPIYRAR